MGTLILPQGSHGYVDPPPGVTWVCQSSPRGHVGVSVLPQGSHGCVSPPPGVMWVCQSSPSGHVSVSVLPQRSCECVSPPPEGSIAYISYILCFMVWSYYGVMIFICLC